MCEAEPAEFSAGFYLGRNQACTLPGISLTGRFFSFRGERWSRILYRQMKRRPTTLNKVTMIYKRYFGILCYTLLAASLLAGCSKSSPAGNKNPEPVDETNFNKLITVTNFGGEIDGGPTTEQKPVYFSLEKKAAVDPDYVKTDRWDISFSALYRSFIGGNNGSNSTNFGSGGPGKGGVVCVERAFDEVTAIPDAAQFKTGSALIGTDDHGAFGQGIGYYLYDFGGTVIGDGTYEKQHVAYCLGNGITKKDGEKVPPRTIIVRTAKGHFAKIRMLSVYKDLLNPSTWTRNAPHMYFSFQYILVKAGITSFAAK